jgi:hypothetical protein
MIVSEWILFSTSNIKHDISIGISDIITFAFSEINKVYDLRSVLINIRIVFNETVVSEI